MAFQKKTIDNHLEDLENACAEIRRKRKQLEDLDVFYETLNGNLDKDENAFLLLNCDERTQTIFDSRIDPGLMNEVRDTIKRELEADIITLTKKIRKHSLDLINGTAFGEKMDVELPPEEDV